MTAGADGECGEAVEGVGNGGECPTAGGGRERVVRIAIGLFRLTLHDRNASARRQRQRQVKAARRRDGVIGQAPGRGQIPTRERGLSRIDNPDRRHLGLEIEMGQARRDRIVRRGNVARGEVATVSPA